MEVKSVYMDLQEGVKKGWVWKLESEAFKKPIEIKIGYDNHELREFTTTCEALDKKISDQNREIENLKRKDYDIDHWLKLTQEELFKQKDTNIFLGEEIQKNKSEMKSLYKEIATQKTMIETLSGTILHLQEQVKLLEKKATKQPMVYHDKCFISGRESVGLWVFEMPAWQYLMLLNTKVWEHNEYVTNEDGFIMEKVRVEGNYVPFYKLVWGTELDTPTATIYYDLVFIPI